MHYQDERTYGCRISDAWTYRGLKTVVLENEVIRVIVLADKGADIYSFVHKPSDTEFMWRTPWGVRDPSKFLPTSGAPESVWLDVYEGGWQTALPHGGYPDKVYGAEVGLHGEVNTMPWDVEIVEDSIERVSVRFRVNGIRMPFSAEKTLTIETGSPVLTLDEAVSNDAEEEIDCVWLEHIAIGPPFLSDRCRLYVPSNRIVNHPEPAATSSKLKSGWEGPWPHAATGDGGSIDFSRIPPKEDRSLDMAYMAGMEEGWYAVSNEETGIGWAVSYPADLFKYLWFWRNLGGGWGYPWYGRCYNIGLEPCTSFHNGGLKQAQENGTALTFQAGQTIRATIKAIAYAGSGEVTRVDPSGRVLFAKS
ncbi:MAG: DUF4432 family protein [Dehalococcoidia bacterium]